LRPRLPARAESSKQLRLRPPLCEIAVMTSADFSLLWAALWNWFGRVLSVAIPSAAVVATALWGLFKWSGQKWVERLLNRDLEQFKHEQQEKLEGFKAEQQQKLEALKGDQQKELERLRHLLLTRVSKIHEKEFEFLPKAWLMLNDLHGAVTRAVDLTMKYSPDFENFSPEKLDEFLNSEPTSSMLRDYQKQELRAAEDKDAYYMNAVKSHYIDVANEKHQAFLNYLIEHQIFMTDNLRTKFHDAQQALLSALTSYNIGERAKVWELVNKGQEEMLTKMHVRIAAVEKAIQERLHYEDAY
jgi:hypothetical protein